MSGCAVGNWKGKKGDLDSVEVLELDSGTKLEGCILQITEEGSFFMGFLGYQPYERDMNVLQSQTQRYCSMVEASPFFPTNEEIFLLNICTCRR
jgi:hypothetical protein